MLSIEFLILLPNGTGSGKCSKAYEASPPANARHTITASIKSTLHLYSRGTTQYSKIGVAVRKGSPVSKSQNFPTMANETKPKSLQQLLDEPKGKTKYYAKQAFMLHVFWEAPSLESAQTILSALNQCAIATHRDTPCVPTYSFRLSALEAETASPKPLTASQHPQLSKAQKKLQVGVPRPAVVADLVRRDLDPALLDLQPDDLLPDHAQLDPVVIECTELYLDERAFFEHAGSKDYLQAYGEVMAPGLSNDATTVRLGTPTAYIVEKILEPMLKERVAPIVGNCAIWRPGVAAAGSPKDSLILSINAVGDSHEVATKVPRGLVELSTSYIVFAHPLREGRVRILCVLSALPAPADFEGLAELPVEGVEVHCSQESQRERMDDLLRSVLPAGVACHVSPLDAGYVLHEKAGEIREE